MKRKSYSQILDQIARDHMAETTDLAPRILARIQKGKHRTMQTRMKILVTIFLILLVLAIGLVSVPGVRAAIQRWIGYVPGVGLVSEGKLRMLAEPVSVTRDGFTLTVKQMLAASDWTFIQYAIEGPITDLIVNASSLDNGCKKQPILRLRDGELLPMSEESATGTDSGSEFKYNYPVIPSTVNDVTFVMPCILAVSPGKAPENWELSLHLIPAPPDMTFPVLEISTLVEAAPTVSSQIPMNTGWATDGISLALDRAVLIDDGYVIYATIHDESTGFLWIDIPDPSTLLLLDSNGKAVPYELDYEATNAILIPPDRGQTAFVIKTAPLQMAGSLTLVLDAVSANPPVDGSFTFDPGPNPKPGQVWDLNQDIDVGHGYSLQVLSATYDLVGGTDPNLRFDIESDTGVMGALLVDGTHEYTGVSQGEASFSGTFSSGFGYVQALPEGPITVNVKSIRVNLPVHLKAAWTP